MTKKPCPKCDKPHPGCTAHSKRSGGQPCGLQPLKGQKVCRVHGGRAPQTQAKAKQRLEKQAAKNQATILGIPIKTTPDQALLDELYRTAGEVAWLDAKVRELNELDLIWNKTRTKRSYDDPETIYEAKPSTWYLLWRDARDRLVRVAEACKKANIEERRIQLAEDQGRLIAGVLQRIFNRLDLTDSQQKLIPIVVPEELRALTHKETEQ